MKLAQQLNTTESTANAPTSVHFLGTYTLKELTIKLKNDSIIDLSEVFEDMTVNEDIYRNSIYGSISIKDYVGGQEKFILTGGETIKIIALKPNGMNHILVSRDDLIVTEISPIQINGFNGRYYTLYFESSLAINSLKRQFFKSYGADRNLNSVVKKIYSEMGGKPEELLITDSSKIPLSSPYISAGYTPLSALNMLAKRACVNEDYFVFFERFNSRPGERYKHFFVGLNELKRYWENLKSIPKIIYEPKTGQVDYIGNSETDTTIMASSVKVNSNFNHKTNIATGLYNSRIKSLNLIERKYSDLSLNYLNENNEIFADVHKNKFLDANNIFAQFDETTIERLIVSPNNDVVPNKAQWLKYDTFGGMIQNSMTLNVRISGGSNYIGIGSLVELNLPSDFSKTLQLESPVPHEDQMYSGKYLVSAVSHIFTPKSYEKQLEISRGSLKMNIDKLVEKNQIG